MQLTKKDILEKLIINPGTKKCFIFDLDGTIIFDDKPLGHKYEGLLKKIHEANHEVVFASGRPRRDFQILMPRWTHEFSMALFGGGLSLKAGQIVKQNAVPKNNCIDLIEICHKNDYPFILDDHLYYYHPDKEHQTYALIDNSAVGRYRVKNLENILDNEIYKIFILEDSSINIFAEYVKNTALELHHHTRFKSFDILPSGVNKYSGINHIVDYALNDVFVFGDDLNDYELFLQFHNSTLLGQHDTLGRIAKVTILDNELRYQNLEYLIDVILTESL